MATKAFHNLGDISRDEPDLCAISDEDDENWIGNWVTGLGFVFVKFPKETTRELTEEEFTYWNGRPIQIASQAPFPLKIHKKPN